MATNLFSRQSSLVLFYGLFGLSGITAQFPVSVDSVFTFIRYNSIHRNTVDWKKQDMLLRQCLAGGHSERDTMQCFVDIFQAMDDVHTQLFLRNEYFGYYHPVTDEVYQRIRPLEEKARENIGHPRIRFLDGHIVYILLPGLIANTAEQINLFAQMLSDTVETYLNRNAKGCILDLRLNMGGNMYPMLAGLRTLLGNVPLAYETDITNTIVRRWEIRDGNFFIGDDQVTQLPARHPGDHTGLPVAILTGPYTGSSGAMTAIAFKGRSNTAFIGEPTADGYTTSNGYVVFSPEFVLNFATYFVADRNKNMHKRTVDPDIYVAGGDDFEDWHRDLKIREAIRWLTER